MPAVDHDAAGGEARLTAGWLLLLAATVIAGVVMPPLGAVVAAVGALRAHAEHRRGLRTAFIVLAVAFAVLTAFVGVFLMSWGGGGTTATQH